MKKPIISEPTTARSSKERDWPTPSNSSDSDKVATETPEQGAKWPPASAIERNRGQAFSRLRAMLPRWKHIEDVDRPDDVYLSRLMLVRTHWLGLYVHVIRRPDWATCQHDHPWAFATLILRGGYEEEIGGKAFVRRPGYFGYRPRSFEHRITRLLSGPAVTLVVRFQNHESWGFRSHLGYKIDWRRYLAAPAALRVLWCDDRPAERSTSLGLPSYTPSDDAGPARLKAVL